MHLDDLLYKIAANDRQRMIEKARIRMGLPVVEAAPEQIATVANQPRLKFTPGTDTPPEFTTRFHRQEPAPPSLASTAENAAERVKATYTPKPGNIVDPMVGRSTSRFKVPEVLRKLFSRKQKAQGIIDPISGKGGLFKVPEGLRNLFKRKQQMNAEPKANPVTAKKTMPGTAPFVAAEESAAKKVAPKAMSKLKAGLGIGAGVLGAGGALGFHMKRQAEAAAKAQMLRRGTLGVGLMGLGALAANAFNRKRDN